MKKKQLVLLLLSAFAGAIIFSSCKKLPPGLACDCNCSPNDLVATSSVYATGLNLPRGLKFGPDGNLYVAEAGVGGTNLVTSCQQVIPPVGPYKGSDIGSRISEISNGQRITVADNLPSSTDAMGDIMGVGDVAFIGNQLYGVLTGAGCSHGVPDIPNGVVKVLPGQQWSMFANLSAFIQTNPVAHPNPGDFEPDGTWYSMQTVGEDLYAVEPNHGEIDKIDKKGNISRFVDISATQGHIVPTSIIFHDGSFYMVNLSHFPITGNSNVYKISLQGKITTIASGFSMAQSIAFDKAGGIYVLEGTTNNPFPTPATGDVIRIDPSGVRTTIVSGLNFPTAMVMGPDNKLYISNWGFGPPLVGNGQILQVSITCQDQTVKKQS
ncbi:MAG TPA: ScyD/ScyE family protein [Hanamia sp.]|nr:ScyD/ScyE family protein [Hanamia sp.]